MRHRSISKCSFTALVLILAIVFTASDTSAQSSAFTYQGRLTDGGTVANGNYDLQFALWDSLSGGAQVGLTQTLNTVAVSNGIFTVSLDFGANAFPGASRFLEISARPSGGGSFTLLSPRQQITSTPYALRSLIATTAENVPASGVPAGSGNYIQNSSSPQASSNFNISGNGTAAGTLSGSVVNATTQFNLNGSRILSNPGTDNLFAGTGAGAANTTGFQNTYIGAGAGRFWTAANSNTFIGFEAGLGSSVSFGQPGGGNTFVGASAGAKNTSGFENTFIGAEAGRFTDVGRFNTFVGGNSGGFNGLGVSNSFFGHFSGLNNGTGKQNSFFGDSAGGNNLNGESNVFIGYSTGLLNTSGNFNTVIGTNADVAFSNLSNATAIGAHARVDQSNSLVLGSIDGVNNATADTKVGIGTTAPAVRFHVVGTTGLMGNVGIGTTAPSKLLHVRGTGSDGPGNGDLLVTGTGTTGSAITLEATGSGGRRFSWISTASAADPGGGALAAFDVTGGAYRMVINSLGNVGIATTSPTATLSVNGTANKPGGGSWAVFSDERLKNIKGRFTPGLRAVMQLQPLRYEYKRDNALDIKSEGDQVGFSAQAIQKIIPEAVTATDQGYLLINNDPILWTMLNAIKEQQAQIARLQQANSALNTRLHEVEKALRKKSSAPRRSRR